MRTSIIVAHSMHRVIGLKNELPWHLPNDLMHFKRITMGHHVVMGRKTFESLPQPLLGRNVIIMTNNKQYSAINCLITQSLAEGITQAKHAGETELFIAGGGQIYQEALPWADKIYCTEVHTDLQGDTHFPQIKKSEWQEVSRITHKADRRHAYAYDFVELIRRKIRP